MVKKYFKTKTDKIPLPVFFPDATRGNVKTLDSEDLVACQTTGVLVNTYHLYKDLGTKAFEKYKGIGKFMNWNGGIISDSGGFQVMSLVKKKSEGGKIIDEGAVFRLPSGEKMLFTPEASIKFQFSLDPDMMVVLDEFTEPGASYEKAKETVTRTIDWAKRSKAEFERICKKKKLTKKERPYLLGVVQGGDFLDLRALCTKALVEIGFDGLGYGGWPIKEKEGFNYDVAKVIAQNCPKDYFLYGLGIGKPHEIVECVKLGYTIFDCVLPTRDARHKRLYVFNASSIKEIDLRKPKFYSYYVPDRKEYFGDSSPVSKACDCLLCTKYSRGYLAHLFKIKELTALRLATIHNLRFYSILMEKLRSSIL